MQVPAVCWTFTRSLPEHNCETKRKFFKYSSRKWLLIFDKIAGQWSVYDHHDLALRYSAPPLALAALRNADPAPDCRRGMECVLVLCRLAGRSEGRCLACAGGPVRPKLHLRQAVDVRLSVPP